jgi:hypothetical protein
MKRTLARVAVLLPVTLLGPLSPVGAVDLPPHPPLRILIVSDEVNPHGLLPPELTQPGDLSAAFAGAGFGLNLDPGVDAILEVPTDDLHLATAALSVPPGDPLAYDVLVYFAHRLPEDEAPAVNQAHQDAFTAAVEAFLVAGGGVLGFHHGNYTAPGKAGMLDILGGTASSVAWNTTTGQDVIDVAPGHFITTHAVEYPSTVAYADPANGVAAGTYGVFSNLPDERYPAFSINPSAGDVELLFASDYVENGATHVLGFTHRHPAWAGVVVVYQPGEFQPQALDDTDGNNAQILANALVYAANACASDASWSLYGSGTAGTLGVPSLTLSGDPTLGEPFDVQLGNSLGAPLTAALLVGFAPTSLALKGGTLLVDLPFLQLDLALPTGGLDLPVVLPVDAEFCGLPLFLQSVMWPDPGAPKDFAFSRGAALSVGM